MSKVLSISTDRKIFEEGSAVLARMVEYAELFEEMHIVVFSTRIRNKESGIKTEKIQVGSKLWIYPTNSSNRLMYVFDAVRIGRSVIRDSKFQISDSILTCQDPFETGLVGLILKSIEKIPLHIQIHTDFLSPYFLADSFLNKLRLVISKIVLPKADAIRVVSERIASSLKNTNYQLKTNPVVLPIFTDLDRFKIAKPVVNFQSDYPNWDFVILVVARLTKEKKIDFAIDVLNEILKKYPRVGMLVVGEGPELENLKSKVGEYNIENSVAFLGWQKDVSSYYKSANLYLQTSAYEGFGLSLLEACASLCPSVSSDVGIAQELLSNKGRSYVCPVDDLNCFVSHISEFIENPQAGTFFSWQIAPDTIKKFVTSKNDYLKTYKESIESAKK
jgi:glycosyltransferase involved in cell wall biosynthesis